MLDLFLTEALSRLDTRLLAVCDAEERRAVLLAGDGRSGWDGVRNLVRPSAAALTGNIDVTELLPDEPHPLHQIGSTLQLEDYEIEALLVVLAGFLEPRYQSLYAVLQDDLRQSRPTERLLLAVAGGNDLRRRLLRDSLSRSGRLGRSGLITAEVGNFPPLGRPFSMPDDVVAVLTGITIPGIAGAASQRLLSSRAASVGETDSSCLILHGRGDHAEKCRSLVQPNCRVLCVKVPVGAEAISICQAAWRIGLVGDVLPLVDLADVDEERRLALAQTISTWTTDLGGRIWISVPDPLPVPIRQI